MILIRYIFVLVILMFAGNVEIYGQTLTNVEKMQQVYGSYYTSLNADQVTWLENCLSRCEVVEMPITEVPSEGIKTLSSDMLITKFVTTLTLDTNYDEATFNPLKYNLKFTNKDQDQYFRIGTTIYVLKVNKLVL